ncbi:MAG: hypothetical protein NC432_13390 [Roseburia sp.]|nr:hypothetical protein [Roseburia sp.]MCM1096853.1 hypothetical protein [Ruminococcus flavefaciens]
MVEFHADSKYLVFPVSYHARNKRLYFYIDEKLVYDIVFSLDYDKPDFYVPLNIERFYGKTVQIDCDKDIKIQIDKRDSVETAYDGKYRPYAHFTAKRGWLNDPNGLVYYKGCYHMFFQHNPVDCKWENMHWGHAVSNDLIHWQEKEIALYPDEDGTVFSGSAIIDRKNVTGLKQNDNDVVLIFYTCAGSTSEASKRKPFTQNLAYSVDGGNTFTRYEKTLISQTVGGNRDPKVIYYEPDNSYILALYLDNHEYALYKSDNMLDWAELQHIHLPEDAECPDFFPLAADNNSDNVKWIFIGASDRYFIGNFDGEHFNIESALLQLNYGNNSYAAQSWSDIPGRRIRTASSTVIIPGEPYASCMNLPQEMFLKTIGGELKLCVLPVKETKLLYAAEEHFTNVSVSTNQPFKYQVSSKCCDISLRVPLQDSFVFTLFGFDLSYDTEQSILKCIDKEAPVRGENGFLTIRLIMDTVNTEIFVDSGSIFMGMTYIQDYNLNTLSIMPESSINNMDIHIAELNPFWKDTES